MVLSQGSPSTPGPAAASARPTARVASVRVVNNRIEVSATAQVTFRLLHLQAPPRLLVDMEPCTLDRSQTPLPAPPYPAGVTGIRLGQFQPTIARVVLDVESGVTGEMQVQGLTARVSLRTGATPPRQPQVSAPRPVAQGQPSRPGTNNASSAPSPSRPAARPPTPAAPPTQVQAARWTLANGELQLSLQMSAPVKPRLIPMQSGYGLRIELPSASVAPDVSLEPEAFRPVVDRVLTQVREGLVAFVLSSAKPVAVDVRTDNGSVTITARQPRNVGMRARDLIVCVDPGHGGQSPGAVGRASDYSVSEKDIVLAVAARLKAELEKETFQVVMTRVDDSTVDLGERPRIATNAGAHVFISLHCDSNSRPNTASGTSTYYHTTQADSLVLAQALHAWLAPATGLPNRGIRQDTRIYATGFGVLRRATMPAVLVELAYINNDRDREQLLNPAWQQKTVEAIVRGLKAYLHGENIDQQQVPAPVEDPQAAPGLQGSEPID